MKRRVMESTIIDINKIEDFIKSKIYQLALKQAKQLFFYAEDDAFYRKNVFEPDPSGSFTEEVDNFEYAVNLLSGIQPSQKDIRIEYFNIIREAKERVKKAVQKLSKPYFSDPDSDKFKDNVKPNFYNKLTLELYTNMFTLFGIDWPFIWPWYFTRKDPTSAIIKKNAALKKQNGGEDSDFDYTQEYDVQEESRNLVFRKQELTQLHEEFVKLRVSLSLNENNSKITFKKKLNEVYQRVLGI